MLRWMEYPHPSPIGATTPRRPGPPHYRGYTNPLRHIAAGRTALDEWSALRSDLYLGSHNSLKTQTSVSAAVYEPTIPATKRPLTHGFSRAATRTGVNGVMPIGLTYHCYNSFMESHPPANLQPLLLWFTLTDRPPTDERTEFFLRRSGN
jgi:hypothetical protein